ncbi:putative transcriptional regulator [Oceanicola granulosus HTCC2516]|uniref:Putative transcriptional regulator n=1 Tax=Oceanicola granulosus (strain ATCC BAA-861 / DSM 15982 / KCTC 12143 / HTCC2516) TaxID=314256 RepID=Q2CC22_OCEGH|nr:GntR family transcriptional regulator [Oceanicola granulosus]EAR50259.1 putative transcriptional regulator [Oceanicola granulosus HTCC2516]
MSHAAENSEAPVAAEQKKNALLKEEAYARIKAHLFQVDDEGTIFSERSLAKTLDIGLASVRSAVERLRSEGIIVSIPKGGIRLPEITSQDVIDFYELRLVIETHLVARIAGKLPAARCDELRGLIARQRAAAESGDTLTYHQLDLDFHDTLARFHGNAEMIRALGQMRDKMYRLSRRLHRTHPERLAVNVDQHAAIVEAICTGEGDVAGETMRAHLAWGRDFTLDPDGRIS